MMTTPSTQPAGDEPKSAAPAQQLPSSDSASELSSSPKGEKFQPGWRFIAAFLSLCIVVLMAALDATSISVALPVGCSVKTLQCLLTRYRAWQGRLEAQQSKPSGQAHRFS